MVVQLETMPMNSTATGRKEPAVGEAMYCSMQEPVLCPWTGVDGDVIPGARCHCAWGTVLSGI